MRNWLKLFLLITLTGKLISQSYFYEIEIGGLKYLDEFQDSALVKLHAPGDDVLSEWQELPFYWEFYGDKVDGYHISDNGYIVFNKGEWRSRDWVVRLPDTTAPRNAIFAFWHDLRLEPGYDEWTNLAATATMGEAPNRTHIIYWMAIVPNLGDFKTDKIWFGIAIHEGGDFEIFLTRSETQRLLTGLIGCQNKSGKYAQMVDNHHYYKFPELGIENDDDIRYKFSINNSTLDASVNLIINKEIATKGMIYDKDFYLSVRNEGVNDIISFDITYKYNDNIVGPETIDFHKFKTNQSIVLKLSEYIPENDGRFDTITAWVSNVKDGLKDSFDSNTQNDTAQRAIYVNLGNYIMKNLLVEEFTGAGCGFCPGADLAMKEIGELYPDAILAAIHSHSGADGMKNSKGVDLADQYIIPPTHAMVNRKLFTDREEIYIDNNFETWKDRAYSVSNDLTSVKINFRDTQYERNTRELDFKVEIETIDHIFPGDLNLTVYLIEEEVRGEGYGFDQANAYNNNSKYKEHPFYNAGDPIKNYVHKNVLREILSYTLGDWIEEPVFGNRPPQKTYNIVLPKEYDENKIKIVAFASYFGKNPMVIEVLNSAQFKLSKLLTIENDPYLDIFNVFPNPVYDKALLEINEDFGDYEIRIYNILGMELIRKFEILTGKKAVIELDFSNFSAGQYFISIRKGDRLKIVSIMKL